MMFAARQAAYLFGQFRRAEANDPEVFIASITRVFAAYPPEVVNYVVDPITGLPGRHNFPPDVKDVKAACDERAGFLGRMREREILEQETIAARKASEDVRGTHETLGELKAKHGDNWGLKANPARENDASARARRERLAEANRRVFEAECAAAGFPPDSPVSPSLAKLIRERTAA